MTSCAIFILIEFLNPVAWWGLLGLTVPILIHLLSKKEKNIISFGSLRFLQPLESETAKSIQLTQYLLLLLRLLLIGLICFLLFGPFLKNEEKSTAYWIEEGIYNNSDYQTIQDELLDGANIIVFSHARDTMGVQFVKSAWTLINYLNTHADSSKVYTHSLQKNFTGDPVEVSPTIDWNIVPYKNEESPSGIFVKGEEAIEWTIDSNMDQVSVSKLIVNEASRAGSKKLKLILQSKDQNPKATQFKQLIDLLQNDLAYEVEWLDNDLRATNGRDADWNILVGSDTLDPDKNYIQWMPGSQPLRIEVLHPQLLRLSGAIDRENIIDSNLPVVMASYFNKYMTAIEDSDTRVLDPKGQEYLERTRALHSSLSKEWIPSKEHQGIQRYILFLIVPLLMVERYLSFKNNE